MPHPVRVLCAVRRSLVPYQPDVRPSLGDALVIDAEHGALAPAFVGEALQAAPWCAVVLLIRGPLGAREFSILHRELPLSTAAVHGGCESNGQALSDAVRNRGTPSIAGLLAYLARRGLSRPLIDAVDDALRLSDFDYDSDSDSDSDSGYDQPKPASMRRAINRHLAECGPLRVGHWRRLVRLLAFSEAPSTQGLDQRAWEVGFDPRTVRTWAAELLGTDLSAPAECPGWEWKVEAVLRRHGYVPWVEQTRRRSGALARPLLPQG